MPAYDSNFFNPPAPVARVSLRDFRTRTTIGDVPMLIDSGADVTAVPQTSIDELNLDFDPNGDYQLESFDGRRSLAKSVQLDLMFLSRTLSGRYVVVASEIGILGRDVLNHSAVLLDGPQLSWQEQKNSAK